MDSKEEKITKEYMRSIVQDTLSSSESDISDSSTQHSPNAEKVEAVNSLNSQNNNEINSQASPGSILQKDSISSEVADLQIQDSEMTPPHSVLENVANKNYDILPSEDAITSLEHDTEDLPPISLKHDESPTKNMHSKEEKITKEYMRSIVQDTLSSSESDISDSSTQHSPNAEKVEDVNSLNSQNNNEINSQASPGSILQKDSISSEVADLQIQDSEMTPPNSDLENVANKNYDILPSEDAITSLGHDTEDMPLLSRQNNYEISSLPESDPSQVNTSHYLAGFSSSYPKELTIVRKSKVLKKRKRSKLSLTDESSTKNASVPHRVLFQSDNACQTDGLAEKLERLELPGLVAVQQNAGVPAAGRAGCSIQDKHAQQTVLCSAINAKFHGSVGAVLVPLDNLSVRSSGAKSGDAIPARRGVTVDMHTNYQSTKSKTAAAGRNVDAHVTYREPNQIKGQGPQWKVDVDGSGLQVIVNMADERKKKIKPPKKVNRPMLSHWPKKSKLILTKASRKRLEWLEDEAEEKHVLRLERARGGQREVTTLKTEEQETIEKQHNFLTSVKIASIENHVQRMNKADHIRKQRVRLMAERPSYIPSPNLLPLSPNMGIYEDENSKRMREARDFYNNLSIKQTSKI